ncbi:MAG: C39 family peptidase [Candidatus Kaiserbacteria bacterium]|nr:C39 family peptidase [Candidatus Kaiserbacteria bacterium]
MSQAASTTATVVSDLPVETPIETAQVTPSDTPPQSPVDTVAESLGIPEAVETPKILTEMAPETQIELVSEISNIFDVPFYSQFNDISAVKWQKIGCGIASLAMLIEYYKPGEVSVDVLLDEGISSGAYLSGAGWIHRGLALLANDHGLDGMNYDLSSKNIDSAFAQFETALKNGPVIASVYYTFDPKSPIPHLVVVNGISDGVVYYNDPSDASGGGSISTGQFKKAWKKRYIEVRPIT